MAALAERQSLDAEVRQVRRRWLVTGAAGFIGSHLLQSLLQQGQRVIALDNFATGHRSNLDEVRTIVGAQLWSSATVIEGDIRDPDACREACREVDIVLHQAALGSVPRSLADPLATHAANATGFLNMLVAAREASVARFVYAASSSTYGDHPALPKVEDRIGRPLSPYAVTKYLNELYAEVFGRSFGMQTIGLRYFNVFGARQDPEGPYAAVIPTWARQMLAGQPCVINGDGETSRDFCHVANAVQANLRAGLTVLPEAINQVYNVAAGGRTTLNRLHEQLAAALSAAMGRSIEQAPRYAAFRSGDVRHSQADVGKAQRLLGYAPLFSLESGLVEAAPWYVRRFASAEPRSARVH